MLNDAARPGVCQKYNKTKVRTTYFQDPVYDWVNMSVLWISQFRFLMQCQRSLAFYTYGPFNIQWEM